MSKPQKWCKHIVRERWYQGRDFFWVWTLKSESYVAENFKFCPMCKKPKP